MMGNDSLVVRLGRGRDLTKASDAVGHHNVGLQDGEDILLEHPAVFVYSSRRLQGGMQDMAISGHQSLFMICPFKPGFGKLGRGAPAGELKLLKIRFQRVSRFNSFEARFLPPTRSFRIVG